ncbi:putative lipoprotein [Yersinia mollaretii]|uniref:TIGR03751 family conjugal transfer lipoprotein n=1 Tax=Yersinia mollaretii TaxID=33060 RepID=UPI0005E33AB6|nr:TIGR03751 family conjugal transfer lipoprotein [Yersinia mollaretii]CNL09553.1 putative lipoprotein [Yersinia mollaretii]
MSQRVKVLFVALIAISVAGCSTSKDEILPAGDSTMLALWQNKALTHSKMPLLRRLTDPNNDAHQAIAESYTRTAENEIQQLFPRLPNPDMVIYIYPHMSGSEPVPVPGYSSVFPFYSRVQYALPGERLEAL